MTPPGNIWTPSMATQHLCQTLCLIIQFKALQDGEDARFCDLVHLVKRSYNTLKEVGLPSDMNNSPGAGQNTLRRLAVFVYLDHPTKSDVTSGKKAS